MKTDTSNRRYELDWLRVLAILIVFLYHSTRFFNIGDWHVKNLNTYVWLEIWNVFATRWMMPLFFIISGASLFYAIEKSRGWRRFYVDKFLRLMIPVIVASVTHAAYQVYLERLTHGQFSGSFFSFLSQYFNGVYMDTGMSGNFAFHGMHLWYLFFLFLYSMCCYPIFAWLKGSGQGFLNRISALLAIPGLMYLCFPLPLLIIKVVIPQAVLEAGSGGWSFLYYIWFLISGFIIVSNEQLLRNIKDHRWSSLCLAIVLLSAYLYQLFHPSRLIFSGWINEWIYTFLSFFSSWCWLFAILGFGIRYLSFDRPWLKDVNEGVMPFYVLHQTVLLVFGYYIVAWEIHDTLKWALIFIFSFSIIIVFCSFLIPKFNLLRFLFGMKTNSHFFDIFQKKRALIILHVLFLGLFVFAIFNQISSTGNNRSPMQMMYDPELDILLDSESITDQSSTGVRVIQDKEASKGKAIEFFSGANEQAKSEPKVYIDMHFSAPSGRYMIWLRGKSDIDSDYTDSVWLQVDDQIGMQEKSVRLGNWLEIHPVGIYGWAGDTDDPISIELIETGDHRIRIQPRQIPHKIDQIWLSRVQHRIPITTNPIGVEEFRKDNSE